MRTSLESLVSIYVRLKNRRALEEMRELRRRLLDDLHNSPNHDARHALHDDLRTIEDGLKQLLA
ncbi:hypothetical protein CV770_03290 [Bradyrhizobium sp. AC87j1]|nr:hypothetical protein CV770_03290 [Bradyrhizobium sp. AC87j1]